MPCEYAIDVERKLVITTGTGVLTGAEVLAHQKSLGANKDFNPEFSQLLDFTTYTRIDVPGPMIKVLAERNLFSPRARRAFLVGHSKVAFGIIRMFQAYRELSGAPEQMRIFEHREEALQWLLER